jgi:MFS family permease
MMRYMPWLVAVALFTLGSLLCGLALNSPMLVAARVVQGIGGAMMTPVGRLALVRTFSRSEMLAAMNYVVIPALIGPLLGPFVGGMIVHWLPWRTIFFVNLPIGFLGLWLIRRHMPDYRDAAVAPLGRWGFLLFGTRRRPTRRFHPRAAPFLSRPRRGHHRLLARVLAPATERRQQRQQPARHIRKRRGSVI